MRDTIVDEVREFRDQYARHFAYDLHAMCVDLRREQEISGSPVISFSTKPTGQEVSQPGGHADTNQPGCVAPASQVKS